MSSGALPKQKLSCASMGDRQRDESKVQNSNSELFELTPKPKLICIPKNLNRFFNDLRRTQSLNDNTKVQHPEKSWSVLYVASKKI